MLAEHGLLSSNTTVNLLLTSSSDVLVVDPQKPGHDGEGQMQHFVNDDGFNNFRLPVGWQFLTNDAMSGTINQTNLAKYDDLVQACLATGASCIIDVHNYARFNGQVKESYLYLVLETPF